MKNPRYFICENLAYTGLLLSLVLMKGNKKEQRLHSYSQRPKSERLVFGQRRNPNVFLFELVLFGFRSFGP